MKRLGLLLSLWGALSALAAAEYRGRMQMDETFDPLNSVLQNSLRVRLEQEGVLRPFLAAGNEGSMSPDSPFIFRSGAYGYVAPGVRTLWGPWTLSAEARFRKYHFLEVYEGAPVPDPVDVQVTLAYDGYWDWEFIESPYISRFVSAYSETVYSSADRHNVSHNSSVKFGLGTEAWKGANLSVFVEPGVYVDRVVHYYNNRGEVKLGSQIRYVLKPAELEFTAGYLFNRYWNRPFKEAPPARNQGFAAKLTLAVAL